jgi:polar amino acid transport system substrate-binding protein
MGYNENAIFVKKGKEFPFAKWTDLRKKVGVMMLGVSIGKYFDSFLQENIKLIKVNSNRQAFGLLGLERADFSPFGRYAGMAFLRSTGQKQNFSALETSILKGKLNISMSNKSKYLHLLPQIEALMQHPTYDYWVNQLLEKHATIYANDYAGSLLE